MKKVLIGIGIFICLIIAIGVYVVYGKLDNTERSEAEQAFCELKTKTKEAKAQKTNDDGIFIYTLDHRHKKFQPTETESRMAITKILESVNENEFADNLALEEVFLHTNIKHIVNGAFRGCKNIKAVHFPGEIPVINDEAFMDCRSLKHLRVDVWTVGLNCFKNCTSLETAHFGEHLWWLREGSFENCRSLRSILMGIAVPKMEEAFKGCTNVQEFSVPNDVKNRLFGMLKESQPKWKAIYLLTTEFYKMPKNCTPNAQCTLYVPDAFIDQFREDTEWSKFGKIEPLSKTPYYTAEGFWKKKLAP